MASLRRIQGSPYWIACFTLPNGKRTSRSTKTVNRREAQRIAHKWAAAAAQARQEQRVLSQINGLSPLAQVVQPSFCEFCAQWLQRKQVENPPGTYRRYEVCIRRALDLLGDKADESTGAISELDISRVRDKTATSISVNAANYLLRVLRIVLNAAKRQELISVNAASNIGLIRVHSTCRRRPFMVSEVQRVLEVADVEWRGMVLFGFHYGLRLGDAARLSWDNVDFGRSQITVNVAKTGQWLELPIAQAVSDYLNYEATSPQREGPVFPRLFELQRRSPSSGTLSKLFLALLKRAGVVDAAPPASEGGRSGRRRPSQLSFHSLRHTATSLLKQTGAADATARALVAHKSAVISDSYTHVETEAKAHAVNRLSDLISGETGARVDTFR